MQENGVHNESGAGWDIKSMTLDELTALMKENGFPAFRAKQLYRWMHVSLVREYSEMRNIPKAMAEQLSSEYPLTAVRMIDRQVSKLDGTQKYLFAMADNSLVESVFMRYKFGNSVCISSQVGCRMGCKFCASTLDGLFRSLTPSEMLDQIYETGRGSFRVRARWKYEKNGNLIEIYEIPYTTTVEAIMDKTAELIKAGRAQAKVLKSHDRWYGVTYKEDKEGVVNALQALKDKGLYPQELWG